VRAAGVAKWCELLIVVHCIAQSLSGERLQVRLILVVEISMVVRRRNKGGRREMNGREKWIRH
jgi:hypothetical protein